MILSQRNCNYSAYMHNFKQMMNMMMQYDDGYKRIYS